MALEAYDTLVSYCTGIGYEPDYVSLLQKAKTKSMAHAVRLALPLATHTPPLLDLDIVCIVYCSVLH